MPMTEDFSAFLDESEHATTAVYKTLDVLGIFEDQYVEVNGVETLKPTFFTDAVSLPEIVRGNPMLIDNVEYKVAAKQPDGTGMILIILEAIH